MVAAAMLEPIVTALQAREFARVEALCRAALEQLPHDPKLLFLLGYSLREAGRADAAVAPFAELTQLRPDDATYWSNYAVVLALAGDIAEAERAAETAVRCAPNDAEKLERLGVLQLQSGHPAEARRTLLQAHTLQPDSVAICLHAARACLACHDPQAGDLLRAWRDWPSLTLAERRELADLLAEAGQPWDAAGLLEALIREVPDDWTSTLLLSSVYERVNRLPLAHDCLDRVARGAPADDGAIAHEMLVQKAKLALRSGDHAAARAWLEQAGPWGGDDASHYFVLAKACDRLGDSAAAMRALATAHALQVAELRASQPDLVAPGAPWLPHAAERVAAADYRSWPALRAPDASQSPVFIVGFPRSGTTLLEQMLDAHPRLQSMDERPFLDQLAGQLEDMGVAVPGGLQRLDQRDCDELRKGYVLLACGKVVRDWRTRLVDKNPLNMLRLPLLHRMFPHAKIVLALRHPCDVILSCYLQNFRSAALIAAGRSLTHLANAYVAAMENWVYHEALFAPDVMVLRYEQLVADPAMQAERLATFLGIDDAASMLQFAARARAKGFIRTPSYSKVVEPIDRSAVGHWLGYRDCLAPVLPILQPMLDHWGYSTDAVVPQPGATRGNQ